ncbi:MAG: PQQ-binding-like beta-propeller repeat protein [Gemmataceae bacterium]
MIFLSRFPGGTLATLLVGLTFVAPCWANFPLSRVFSRPSLPSADTLRRLDLHLAWTVAVPMDGKRDAIYSVVLDGTDLFVLSRSGQVVRIDAETGEVYWKIRPGRKYTTVPHLAVNSRSVFLVLNATLHSINRERGIQEWEFALPGGLSTAPVVDDEQIYVPRSDGRLSAFLLPFIGLSSDGQPTLSPIYGRVDSMGETAPRPRAVWSVDTRLEMAYPPTQTADSLFVIDPSGKAKGFDKIERPDRPGLEYFRLNVEGAVQHPPRAYGNMVFVGCDDANVYAIDTTRGKLTWRYVAGSPIVRPPAVLEEDLYVTSEREGMARLDRATGEPMWKIPVGRQLFVNNTQADQFLAASKRFVYATDSSDERLLILDRRRGVTLGSMDKRDFRYPIVNFVTDRIYLAANNGTIVCLHDREQVEPLRHRKKLEDAAANIHKLLDREVQEPSRPVVTVEEILNILKDRYGVRYIFAKAELVAGGLIDLPKRETNFRAVDRRPLRQAYMQFLSEVGAGFRTENNILLIVPKNRAKMEPPGKEPKNPPKEPKDPPKEPDAKDPKEPKDPDNG